MLMHTGFDGTAEEMHYGGAVAGVERGYHVLSFDGPGQGAARHLDGLVFRPDWENVVTPVLDWVITRPEVDQSRVGLIGFSMGGLLAPRAAAFEHRLAACVAVDGVYELGSTVLSHFPGSRAEVPLVGRIGDRVIAGVVDRLMVTDAEVLIADFKTNRRPPEEIPDLYIRQMAAYRLALACIYPGRTIRCALVWTDGPRLTEIDAKRMDDALAGIGAG